MGRLSLRGGDWEVGVGGGLLSVGRDPILRGCPTSTLCSSPTWWRPTPAAVGWGCAALVSAAPRPPGLARADFEGLAFLLGPWCKSGTALLAPPKKTFRLWGPLGVLGENTGRTTASVLRTAASFIRCSSSEVPGRNSAIQTSSPAGRISLPP